MNLQELSKSLRTLGKEIENIMDSSGYLSDCDLSKLEGYQEIKGADDLQRLEEYCKLFDGLLDFCNGIRYLDRSIKEESKLFLADDGRYKTDSGYCFDRGKHIEFLHTEERFDSVSGTYGFVEIWSIGRIATDNGNYYIAGYPDVQLDGLTVRIRKEAWE